MLFTYSRWDGTQAPEELDAEVLLEALASDVLESGDIGEALTRLTWLGSDADPDLDPHHARSLVDEFVRERERLRHAHRSEPDPSRSDAPAAAEPGWEPEIGTLLTRPRGEDDTLDGEPYAEQSRPRPQNALGDRGSHDALAIHASGGDESTFDSTQPSMPESRAVLRQYLSVAIAGPRRSSDDDHPIENPQLPCDGNLPWPRVEVNGDAARQMQELDELELDLLEACRSGDFSGVGAERIERVLGQGARELLARLEAIPAALLRAGYLEIREAQYHLTARGLRRIGEKALDDIFHGIKSPSPGDHLIRRSGVHGDLTDGHKRYDAEDDFLLDLNRTLLNAVIRVGPATPIGLTVEDFEVVRTDRQTQASTVLMLDVSPSMPLRGCLAAGRKVALALNALIESRFPRDRLYLVAFSGYARLVRADALHRLRGREREYGTNMHHGFLLARRLLAKHRGGRQIIVITDGEPTAHLEGDRAQFSYPPTARTREQTLREVQRCTRDDIVINTFMLDRSPDLGDFVDDLTRINRGRAFFTTPERLGEYVVTDYVRNRVGG